MECIFCKIIKGELPSSKVYEDKRFLAFLDVNPINKGHVLVIPKEHNENLVSLPIDQFKDMMSVVKKLSQAVVQGCGAEGFNLVLNNGSAAGQSVDHVHCHIIPRFKNDNLHPWPGKQYQDDEKVNYAKRIISAQED